MKRMIKFLFLNLGCLWLVMSGFSNPGVARQGGKTRAEVSVAASKAIKVAAGLTVRHVADDDLAPDCTALTTDQQGRIFVSGPGYVRLLLDRDQDGIYDATETIVNAPGHGAHGLCVDGDTLYYVGDNGVWRVDLVTSADHGNAKPVRVLEIKTGGEHDAHALRKGPDGDWYLIAGNGTQGSFQLQNVASTMVPHPRAGVIWKISADWKQREVWAEGFRNAYDFDFAPGKTIDTFDSDGERDVSLPWYRPTRVFRVHQGQDAGWVSRSWKRANVDPLMPKVLAELGRGSPTGIRRSPSKRLPKRLDNGVYVLDWTFGRVVFVGDDGRTELIASPDGTEGFAVTDIDALPGGELVVSVGGRRSRGGIYLIDATKPRVSEQVEDFVWQAAQPRESNETFDWLCRLRRDPTPVINQAAAEHATKILDSNLSTDDEVILAITLLIESVGGLGPGDRKDARGKQQAAAVFDSCRGRVRPKLDVATRVQAVGALMRRLGKVQTNDQAKEPFCRELVRGLAVLEPESEAVFKAIADDMDRVKAPVDKLLRLIALARIPVPRSDDMTERMAQAMLDIPVQIRAAGLKVDRNWTPRMGELFLAMQHRDSLLPSRLVSSPQFGDATHLIWTEKMDPENLERARYKCLMQSRQNPIDRKIARFIALGPDAVPRNFIYKWLKDDATRSSAWLALAEHPVTRDIEQLRLAALSVDKAVRDSAAKALKRLGEEVPQRESDSTAIQKWLTRMEPISGLNGEPEKGQQIYTSRQCGHCHNGGKALGPSLEGIAKRFDLSDLFRATVDPSHIIPDRYRAQQVLTNDGQVLMGLVVYQSVDGVTLLTADGHTKRVNVDDIDEQRPSRISLMPEGLLIGLSDEEVADLLSYLRSL